MVIRIIKRSSPKQGPPLVSAAGGKTLDSMCRMLLGDAPNGSVSWWLMSCYTREVHNFRMLSDACHEELRTFVETNIGTLTHAHKSIIGSSTEKGRPLSLGATKYPGRVRAAAVFLVRRELTVELDMNKDCS